MTSCAEPYAGQLVTWCSAVTLVGDRVRQTENEHPALNQIDGLMFAWALRNAVRAAEFCRERASDAEVKKRIKTCIAEFEAAFPHVRYIRDVIEHFDEYATGDGRLQQRFRAAHPKASWLDAAPTVPDVVISWAARDFDGVFRLHVGTLCLDIGAAQGAMAALFDEITGALDLVPLGC